MPQAATSVMHDRLGNSLTFIATALGLQTVLLIINKTSQFYIAHMNEDATQWTGTEKLAEWFSQPYAVEFIIDLVSVFLQALATKFALDALGLT